jgi:hypothetical protein
VTAALPDLHTATAHVVQTRLARIGVSLDTTQQLAEQIADRLGIVGDVTVMVMLASGPDQRSSAGWANAERALLVGVGRDLSLIRLARFLAHELTHAWQYEQGLLSNVTQTQAIWKGRKRRYLDGDVVGYWLQPWEMQARRRERIGVAVAHELGLVPL